MPGSVSRVRRGTERQTQARSDLPPARARARRMYRASIKADFSLVRAAAYHRVPLPPIAGARQKRARRPLNRPTRLQFRGTSSLGHRPTSASRSRCSSVSPAVERWTNRRAAATLVNRLRSSAQMTKPLAVAALSCRAVSSSETPSALAAAVTVSAPALSASRSSRLATRSRYSRSGLHGNVRRPEVLSVTVPDYPFSRRTGRRIRAHQGLVPS
jgi:hypothetical protein